MVLIVDKLYFNVICGKRNAYYKPDIVPGKGLVCSPPHSAELGPCELGAVATALEITKRIRDEVYGFESIASTRRLAEALNSVRLTIPSEDEIERALRNLERGHRTITFVFDNCAYVMRYTKFAGAVFPLFSVRAEDEGISFTITTFPYKEYRATLSFLARQIKVQYFLAKETISDREARTAVFYTMLATGFLRSRIQEIAGGSRHYKHPMLAMAYYGAYALAALRAVPDPSLLGDMTKYKWMKIDGKHIRGATIKKGAKVRVPYDNPLAVKLADAVEKVPYAVATAVLRRGLKAYANLNNSLRTKLT